MAMFHAELEATSICDIRCLHCPHEAIARPGGRMSWECFTSIVEKIRAHTKGERFSLSFSGMGEPMLNPLIYKFVSHVSADAKTSFATNGSALTEENVRRLAEAGLEMIYLSFNGDDPEIFAQMTGGLPFDRILQNARQSVAGARGHRLRIAANVSITKANQHRVTRIERLLEKEGIGPIAFSLCHERGGNLRDPEVCDTPPMGLDRWRCDVLENTLFVDWRGRAHICDHDLRDEYELGDLTTESLEAILGRRKQLLDDGCSLQICRRCNDILKAGGIYPLESRAGGNFRDWIHYLYQDMDDPFGEANEAMKWIFRIYKNENRSERLANRLIGLEKIARRELSECRERCRSLASENDALVAKIAAIQRTLDERDREFGALHAEFVAMRRSRAWRLMRMLANDLARLRRWTGFAQTGKI
jgi:sulfatase maturation enzyme AslB (radical SAM superfamily)